MSQNTEISSSSSSQIVTWEWADDKKNWHCYQPKIIQTIEKLQENTTADVRIEGRVYRIYRITHDSGLQTNIHTSCKRSIRRMERKASQIPLWQYQGDRDKWQTFPIDACIDIENLKVNEMMQYRSSEGRSYTIYKIDSTNATQKNVKTKKKRPIRKISNHHNDNNSNNNKEENKNKFIQKNQSEKEPGQEAEQEQEQEQEQEKEKKATEEQSPNNNKKEDKSSENQAKQDDQNLCLICFDADRSHILIPCGHYCLCGICAEDLDECPVCRAKIEKINPVFQA